MGKIAEFLTDESKKTLEKTSKNSKKVAGTIFNNMLQVAKKKKMAIQFEGNRVKKIRVRILSGNFWFTPYIFNDQLYLAHDWFVAKGSDVFGNGVNKVHN